MHFRSLALLGLLLACNGKSGDGSDSGGTSAASAGDAGDASDVTDTSDTGDDTGAGTTESAPTSGGPVTDDEEIEEYCSVYCGKYVDCFGADGPDDEAQCVEDCIGTIVLGLDPACVPQWKQYMVCVNALECDAFENPTSSTCSDLIAGWNNEMCIKDF